MKEFTSVISPQCEVTLPDDAKQPFHDAARIEANKERIDLLWEAHYIQHDQPTKDGG